MFKHWIPLLACYILGLRAGMAHAETLPVGPLITLPPVHVTAPEFASALQKGVKFLIENQRSDGAWGGPAWTGGVDVDPVPGAFHSFDVAVTALCLEALLDVGESSASDSIDRATQFLLDRGTRIRRAGPGDLPNVWADCYCIQVFSELLLREPDNPQRHLLREAVRRHMTGLRRWESIHGGWFYYGSGMSRPVNPSCSFVNAAVLIALQRAKQIGIEADGKMVDRALAATKQMRKPDSSFIYAMRSPLDKRTAMNPINRTAGSLGRSQAGNLALRLWGDAAITDDVIASWLDRLVARHGWLDMGRKRPIPHESHAAVAGYFYYFGMYYGARCIGELPPQRRELYQNHLVRLIIDRQEQDGSWFDYPLYSYHKPYGTAFALAALHCCGH